MGVGSGISVGDSFSLIPQAVIHFPLWSGILPLFSIPFLTPTFSKP